MRELSAQQTRERKRLSASNRRLSPCSEGRDSVQEREQLRVRVTKEE